jgi:uncharacterized membrane protein YsdA (DUF1294 family)
MPFDLPTLWMLYGLALATMGPAAFAALFIDKRRARANGRRVPESTLLALSALGGWWAALLAIRWLRHKTRKVSFLLVMGLIVAVHALVIAAMIRETLRSGAAP